MLTCSLGCSKAHKEQFGCTGQRDSVSSLRVKMQDFTLGTMRKDLKFLDQAIGMTNKYKKKAISDQLEAGDTRIPKKIKNLRYFLKKNRNIVFKHAP
jgi:hypothetical protein